MSDPTRTARERTLGALNYWNACRGLPQVGTVIAMQRPPTDSLAGRWCLYYVEEVGRRVRLANMYTGGGTSDSAENWAAATWVVVAENGETTE